jgi:hypothetical protein
LQAAISFVGLAKLRAALRLPNALGEADYPLFARTLAEAKRSVAAWGGTLYLVYIPTSCAALGGCKAELEAIRERVLAEGRALELPTIDLTPVLIAHRDPPSLYTQREGGHFGAIGNRLVAETVRARLAQDGLFARGN